MRKLARFLLLAFVAFIAGCSEPDCTITGCDASKMCVYLAEGGYKCVPRDQPKLTTTLDGGADAGR